MLTPTINYHLSTITESFSKLKPYYAEDTSVQGMIALIEAFVTDLYTHLRSPNAQVGVQDKVDYNLTYKEACAVISNAPIQAIKLVRTRLGLSLKEAKYRVDDWRAKHGKFETHKYSVSWVWDGDTGTIPPEGFEP